MKKKIVFIIFSSFMLIYMAYQFGKDAAERERRNSKIENHMS